MVLRLLILVYAAFLTVCVSEASTPDVIAPGSYAFAVTQRQSELGGIDKIQILSARISKGADGRLILSVEWEPTVPSGEIRVSGDEFQILAFSEKSGLLEAVAQGSVTDPKLLQGAITSIRSCSKTQDAPFTLKWLHE